MSKSNYSKCLAEQYRNIKGILYRRICGVNHYTFGRFQRLDQWYFGSKTYAFCLGANQRLQFRSKMVIMQVHIFQCRAAVVTMSTVRKIRPQICQTYSYFFRRRYKGHVTMGDLVSERKLTLVCCSFTNWPPVDFASALEYVRPAFT